MKSKKLMLVLSTIIIASLILAACATPTPIVQTVEVQVTKIVEGTPKVETKVQVVTATPVPPTAAPTAAPAKPVDTIVLALQQEPDTLHPLVGSMMARTIVNSTFMPGCISQNEKAEWVAMGCTQVSTIANGGAKFVGTGADRYLEVTYKIKPGWRWTDGTPVTSKDAIYYWKLVMDPDLQIGDRTLFQKLYDVKGPDASTIVYAFMSEKQAKEAAAGTLKGNVDFSKFAKDYVANGYDKQAGPVVDPVYWTVASWLPEHILGKIPAKDHPKSEYARKPVGDGAFVVKEWKAGQEIVLERSDKPFPLGEPKIKTIIYRFFAETAGVLAALQKGEIDAVTGTGGLTVNNAPDLDKIAAAGRYKVLYEPGYQWEHIDLNTTKFPLDDVKVRQALYHATDRKTLVDRLYFGKQSTTDLPVPPFSWAYTDKITKFPFDPNKAKALLAEAGWDCKTNPCTKKVTEGGKEVTKPLELTLMTTDRADRQAVAQVIQAQWKAVGFGVNLQFLYGRGLFATCAAGGPLGCRTFDAAIYTWITGDDPSFDYYTCKAIPTKENNWSGQNYPGWCNKIADEAHAKQASDPVISLDRNLRKIELEKFFAEWTREVPVIPLFSNTRVYVIRTGFKNFKAGPTNASADGWNAHQWELEK